MELTIKEFTSEDLVAMTQLFYQTVHQINAKDYSPAQLNVWAPKEMDLNKWQQRFSSTDTLVAVMNREIVGFANMEVSGYLDCLYVHHQYQRQHIATYLLKALEANSDATLIHTHASMTAVPFFQSQGFEIKNKQVVVRQGIVLENFIMEKRL